MSGATFFQQQQQLILRVPENLSRALRSSSKWNKSEGKPNTVLVKPKDTQNPSNDYICVVNDKEYSATLMNLPCPIETHKTFDDKIFIKSSDIGQILQVFDDEKEKNETVSKIISTRHGDYFCSGLNPPTNDIVKRKFLFNHENEDFLPYRIREITDSINNVEQMLNSINPATNMTNDSKGGYLNNLENGVGVQIPAIETTVEEVIDFEEWMLSPDSFTSNNYGGTIGPQGQKLLISGNKWDDTTFSLLLDHPEILLTEEDREEDEIDWLATEHKIINQQQINNDTDDLKMNINPKDVNIATEDILKLSFPVNFVKKQKSMGIDSKLSELENESGDSEEEYEEENEEPIQEGEQVSNDMMEYNNNSNEEVNKTENSDEESEDSDAWMRDL